MKKSIYSILLSFLFLVTFNQVKAQAGCWANQTPHTYFWDSCANNKGSLNAYISFKVKGCFKYEWSVNGNVVDTTHSILNYKISQNGTYDVCIKVYDTCNTCDTTICSKRTITCFSNSSTCNWSARYPYSYFFDSCNSTAQSLNGYITFKNYSTSCFKYKWTVNGNVVDTTHYILNYKISQNGTYDVCVKIIDTCNNCDTTICSKRTITCFSNSSTCNWSTRPYNSFIGDSCTNSKSSTISAYISFKTKGCYTYQWTVAGGNVSTGLSMQYAVYKNGTYAVCVKVIDTCNNCDTTICFSRVITCIGGGSSTCNWKNRYPYASFWDSCKNSKASLNGYVSFNSSSSCFKYQWTVNGNNAGTNANKINYPVYNNGTYNLCLKVTDTCNNCDTTFCSSRVINCYAATCNWAIRYPNTSFWDSCKNNKASLNGYVSFNTKGCFKYQWSVNGNNVGGNSYYINYPVYNNSTYSLCCKVSDTCNNCDTTFCSSRVITCYSSSSACNWKSLYPYTYFFDSCSSVAQSLNGYISFQNSSTSCFKYLWTVNGNTVGTGNKLNYHITQNGSYDVCIKVSDTCNNCDTTICSKRSITCFSSGSTCNWSTRPYYSYIGDSCIKSGSSTISAYISFKTKGCYKYDWTVAGVSAGNGNYIQYAVSKNGTYAVCVKVYDTCNNCDTTICFSRTITCINSGSACNWASRNPNKYFADSCKGISANLLGYVSFNSSLYKCFKYQWTVNGNAVSSSTGNYINYTVTQNGTYNVCVKVIDTCNNCDTTFCSTRTITCLSGCDWASKTPHTFAWDSCNSNLSFVNAYVSFKVKGCFKYQWTVNGNNAGNGYVMKYAIFNNGTYKICVKVTDTCNNCDTTICFSRTINCYNGINNIGQMDGLKIYPNPSQGVVKIDWNLGNSSYVIYNIAGQNISAGTFVNGLQTLDMTGYPTGVYILQVKTANANLTQKIILQKE